MCRNDPVVETVPAMIITKVPRRGHTGLAVYESWSTNHLSVGFWLPWGIFTSWIPSGMSLTGGSRNCGNKYLHCRYHVKFVSCRRCRNHGEGSFLLGPRACPRPATISNQILRICVKAILVHQPKTPDKVLYKRESNPEPSLYQCYMAWYRGRIAQMYYIVLFCIVLYCITPQYSTLYRDCIIPRYSAGIMQ